MRLALISDIHANLPALESVLRGVKKHSPDAVISLGDQVNLGPCPRETLALLHAEGVTCLHGNHERYILSAMAGDPGYSGANFNALRFNAGLLAPEEITFHKEMRFGHVLLCHAMPGDDRFPVFDAGKALPRLREMDFPEPLHIFCGHGHNPTHIQLGNLTLDSIGSVGCMDDGVPGTAPYVIADIEQGAVFARPYYASYDTRRMPELFIRSGMAEFCPVMAHIVCLQMMRNVDVICGFVDKALARSRAKGEAHVSEATWREADAAFDWPDGVSTAEFFQNV